VNTRT